MGSKAEGFWKYSKKSSDSKVTRGLTFQENCSHKFLATQHLEVVQSWTEALSTPIKLSWVLYQPSSKLFPFKLHFLWPTPCRFLRSTSCFLGWLKCADPWHSHSHLEAVQRKRWAQGPGDPQGAFRHCAICWQWRELCRRPVDEQSTGVSEARWYYYTREAVCVFRK